MRTWPEALRQLERLAAERPVAVLANKVDHASAADNANLHTAVNVNTGNGRCAYFGRDSAGDGDGEGDGKDQGEGEDKGWCARLEREPPPARAAAGPAPDGAELTGSWHARWEAVVGAQLGGPIGSDEVATGSPLLSRARASQLRAS